jgi:outer membrane receptor for ferrienterochelin and colicins
MSTLLMGRRFTAVLLSGIATLLFSTMLLFGLASAAEAQTGTITGKVTEDRTGQPVFAATANALSGTKIVASTRTSEDGTYRLTVPAGTYTVSIQRIGFVPGRKENVTVTAGSSATADLQISETVFQLERTVVSVARTPEGELAAPQSVSVVDVREITERPSVTVSDHLQGLQGVDINKGGIAQSNVVARGFNNAFSGSVLMLQDYRFAGVPSLRVNVPLLFTASNEDVERVEVLLGPASALYGPNSSHGVVHVITKSPFTSQGTMLTLDGGERSLLRGSIRHAGLLSPKLGYKISGEYFTARDWRSKSAFDPAAGPSDTLPQYDPGEPDVFPQAAPPGRRGESNVRDFDINRAVGEVRVDYRPAEGNEYVTTLGISRIGKGMEFTGANGTALAKNWRYISAQQRVRLGRFFAQAFANFSNAGNEDSLDLSGTYLLRSGQPIVDQSRVYALQIQHAFQPVSWEDLIYGLDYISTNPRTGGTINGRNEDIDDVKEIGGYLQSTTQLGTQWELIGTVRVDKNDQVEGAQFSPRVGIIYKPTPTHNFRATYNRAFSTPANFTWFLDLIQARNVGGTPYNVRALGNPPKVGWSFNRTCDQTVSGGLCMRTIFAGPTNENTWLPASAGVAYRGVIQANSAALTAGLAAQIQAGLGVPPATAQAMATQIVTFLGSLQPTDAQLNTQIRYLGSPASAGLTPAQVTDIGPIKASFNNTYEVGYKGIIGNNLRLAVDAWTEERGDVGNPAGLATPNVFWDTTATKAYLTTQLTPAITGALIQAGTPPAQAAAIAAQFAPQVARGVAVPFGALPLGIVSFNSNTFASARDIYATYTSYNKTIWVQGLDFAADLFDINNWSFAATYSWVSDLVFPEVASSNSLPLMLNAPDNKASFSAKYRTPSEWGFEGRVRYLNAYPVNSGVYATDVTFPRPGSTQTYQYYGIPASTLVDININKRFRAANDLFVSLNAENILNNSYRTMPGAPELGRMITTRIQYSF